MSNASSNKNKCFITRVCLVSTLDKKTGKQGKYLENIEELDTDHHKREIDDSLECPWHCQTPAGT